MGPVMTHRFKKEDRVRLKDQPSNLYRKAFVGSEGTIKRLDTDSMGFPMVYVEWDKGHWTYNGEEDMWTFEDHFELVEENVAASEDKNESFMDRLAEFIEAERNRANDEKDRDNDLPDLAGPSDPEQDREYLQYLEAAVEVAKECEAFMIVTVKREASPMKDTNFILAPDQTAYYKTEEAGLLLESQLSQIASSVHQSAIGRLVGHILKERREGRDGGD